MKDIPVGIFSQQIRDEIDESNGFILDDNKRMIIKKIVIKMICEPNRCYNIPAVECNVLILCDFRMNEKLAI